jgi:hypothetical protein
MRHTWLDYVEIYHLQISSIGLFKAYYSMMAPVGEHLVNLMALDDTAIDVCGLVASYNNLYFLRWNTFSLHLIMKGHSFLVREAAYWHASLNPERW